MKEVNKVLGDFIMKTELPSETLPGTPILELIGTDRLLIEGHQGITQYACDCLQVKVNYGFICVRGQGMKISVMTKNYLVISGRIDAITVERRRCM